jgi:hypothetical protein
LSTENLSSAISKIVDWVSSLWGSSGDKPEEPKQPSNMVRGSYGTYIGIENYNIPFKLVNIYIPGYDLGLMERYFEIRYTDDQPFYPIMHRTTFEKSENYVAVKELAETNSTATKYYNVDKFGGDTYVCTYTHRMQRNFEDPEVNINDIIVDDKSFKDNYEANNAEENAKINRSDVNAVMLGHWVTFKLLSNINLNFRDIDRSIPGEEALHGIPRGFCPLYGKTYSGAYKLPESRVINGGISSSNGEKYYNVLPNVPYIKQEFDNTIIYSDVHVTDAFKNGYRTFRETSFQDYTREHGAVMRIVNWIGNLIIVFEHGIAVINVHERVQAAQGAGGPVFINTDQILPENPRIITDDYGTQWPESVVIGETHLYGIDTVAKKIWRLNNNLQLEVISDFKIQSFLNDNITLDEREFTPIIGVRNVKSHYNAFKRDVMFTFYDNTYGLEETVWNICWNELLNQWITFYSWVPGASANIDNIYFSFDRNTMKWISKLGKSNSNATYSEGISIDNVIFESNSNFIGTLSLSSRNLPYAPGKLSVYVDYKLLDDPFNSSSKFELREDTVSVQIDTTGKTQVKNPTSKLYYTGSFDEYEYYIDENGKPWDDYVRPVYQLNIQATVHVIVFEGVDRSVKQYADGFKTYTELNGGFFTNSIAVTPYVNIDKFQRAKVKDEYGVISTMLADQLELKEWLEAKPNRSQVGWYPGLSTDFWKHGQAGLIDIADEIKPTHWYGKTHPFEFEVSVIENAAM